MTTWKKYRLEDAVEKLIDYRGKTPEKTQSGIPLITAKIIKNGRIEEPNEFIAEENYQEWMRRGIPEYGDVVITTEAPLGEVAQIKTYKKVALAQRVITLRGKKNEVDSTYLKYFLQSPLGRNNLLSKETGTTVTGIKQSELREVEVVVPDFSSQVEIAFILSTFDEKIELNLQMNQTLEDIAQAIFKERFNNSTVVSLSKYVELNPKLSVKKETIIKYIEMADLPERGSSIESYVDRPYLSGSKFQNFDTLLARITPCLENGKTGLVDFLVGNEIAWGSTEFIVMRAKEGISPFYVYLLARLYDFREFAIKSMIGTSGRQRVQTDLLNTFEVPEIDFTIMHEFHLIASSLFQKIKANSEENKTLIELRDSLLPKLMAGKIEVNL